MENTAMRRRQNRRTTERQQRFAYHLVHDLPPRIPEPRWRTGCWSAAEAARRAGYSDRHGNARRIAWRTIRRPWVVREILRLAQQYGEREIARRAQAWLAENG